MRLCFEQRLFLRSLNRNQLVDQYLGKVRSYLRSKYHYASEAAFFFAISCEFCVAKRHKHMVIRRLIRRAVLSYLSRVFEGSRMMDDVPLS